MSYYTKIDGVKLDSAIVEACEKAVKGQGDGRVSVEDAEEVFKFVKDAGKVTETELWTMRYCLTEFNFTEAASDWITAAVKGITKYADKVAKGKKIKGYYETVDGVQCDHEVLEVCRKAVSGAGDGRVSKEDAKLVLAAVTDGGKVTQTEKWTLRLCLSEFNWTQAAQDWFAEELKAFTSSKKRPSSTPGRPAKKAKTVDLGKKVKTVVGSLKIAEKAVPKEVLSMVSSMGQKTLPVPKEERHAFQGDAIKMVEKILDGAHGILQKELASAKETIENADAEKVARETAVKEAEEKLVASKATKEKAIEDHNEKSGALKASEDALKAAVSKQKEGDITAVSLEKEKKALEEGSKDWREGELRKAEKGVPAKPLGILTKALSKASIDSSLVQSVPFALKKKPEARAGFDLVIVENLDAAIKEKLEELAAKLEKEGPDRLERQSHVESAKAASEAAQAAATVAQEAQKAAKEALSSAQEALAAAKKSQANFDADIKAAKKKLEKAEADLKSFEEGALGDFKFLAEFSKATEEAGA